MARGAAISIESLSVTQRAGGVALAGVFELECVTEEGIDAGTEQSAEQINEVVHLLCNICRSSSLEFALRVGAVVIHHFYGGDTQAWRDRGPKSHSFRRLAEHPDLPLSAGALYRCVAIFEMCDRLRAPSRWRRLGASHLRAVIGIPLEKQEYLLTKANDERWSVQVLQEKAKDLRSDRTRGGRRAESTLGKHLRSVERCLDNWRGAVDAIDSSEPEELDRSQKLLVMLKSSIEELATAVEAQRIRAVRTGKN